MSFGSSPSSHFDSLFCILWYYLFSLNPKSLAEELEYLPVEYANGLNSSRNLVIIGIALAVTGFILVNAALVAWFFIHQKRKKGLILFETNFIYYPLLFFTIMKQFVVKFLHFVNYISLFLYYYYYLNLFLNKKEISTKVLKRFRVVLSTMSFFNSLNAFRFLNIYDF